MFERAAQPLTATIFYLAGRSIEAQGFQSSNGFVVRAGSHAAKDCVPSVHNYVRELRDTLIDNGVLEDGAAHYELTQDYTFDSPSTASAVMLGRSSNGRGEWKTQDGRTLKQGQDGGPAS